MGKLPHHSCLSWRCCASDLASQKASWSDRPEKRCSGALCLPMGIVFGLSSNSSQIDIHNRIGHLFGDGCANLPKSSGVGRTRGIAWMVFGAQAEWFMELSECLRKECCTACSAG